MMYIFEVPEGENIAFLSEEVQTAISSVSGQYSEAMLPGTQAISGYQIVLAWANATKAELQAMFDAFFLDWSILASEGETVEQAALLPYFLDKPVHDEDGDQVASEQITDLTGKLQVFAGHTWNY